MAMTAIGRFRVTKRLGGGNQGTVFQCLDPALQRQVAIKLLDKAALGDARTDDAFLGEARTMSRIQHPNIVTIYEVGRHQGIPYLVFEYVEGRLLADLVAAGLDEARCLEIFQGLLEGMDQAHRQGIVHRDLKPANIIISAEGTPKIMDFGIARMLSGASEQDPDLIGTPRYMAPEYIEQGRVGTQADVFALGLILYEMLTGAPLYQDKSASAVLSRITQDKVPPPSSRKPGLDPRLDQLILKALERDPDARYADAGEMLQSIKEYRSGLNAVGIGDGGGKSTIEFLLRRMQRTGDFPSLAQSVRTLNSVVSTTDAHVHDLTQAIVKDFALTNKILKVVNSALYARFAGKVGTISRAVVVLGVQPVRALAASLIFFEHMHNKTQAEDLREHTVHALFSAILGGALGAGGDRGQCEDFFLSAMFHDLGRILVSYYLYEESREVERLMNQQGMAPVQAQRTVLGASYEEVGIGIARHWNFPEAIINTLRHPPESVELKPPANLEDRRRLVAACAFELTNLVGAGDLSRAGPRQQFLERFGGALGLDGKQLDQLVTTATKEFLDLTKHMEMRGKEGDFMKRLKGLEMDPAGTSQSRTGRFSSAEGMAGGERVLADLPARTGDRDALLTEGLQEITEALLGQSNISQLCNIVLETMYRALAFRRVLLCLRDPSGREMLGKLGFGTGVDAFLKRFRFPLAWRVDVFHAALKNSVDVYISNTSDAKIQADLPDWFKTLSDAGSFVLFPLVVKGNPVGLIYCDHPDPDGLHMTSKTLSLLKAMRNQLLLGIRERR